MSSQDSHTSDKPVGIGDLDDQRIDHVPTTTRAVRRRLDLDRPVPLDAVDECSAIVPVAYSEGEDFRRGVRRPLDDVTFYDRWGRIIEEDP